MPAADIGVRPVRIDGSSTVFPLSAVVTREFGRAHPSVPITLNVSNTGGGFEKFCMGEVDVTGAARPIRRAEIELCQGAAVRFIELPVAYDGIVVASSRAATWLDHFTLTELRIIWAPESEGKVTRWRQVRDSWPDVEIRLMGDSVGSGSYDYFTMATVGREGVSRRDYIPISAEATLVTEIAGDPNAIGFLPFNTFLENRDRLKAVGIAIKRGGPVVLPTRETILDGTYQPLSHPVFIYVWEQSLNRPEVQQFVSFYLSNIARLADVAGLAPLHATSYLLVEGRFQARWTGTMFGEGGSQVGLKAEDLLEMARIP